MKRGIPVANRRVVAPKGDLEEIIVVVPDDGAFHFYGVAGGQGVESHFTVIADLTGKCRSQMEVKLAEIETARRSLLIRRGKIHVSKSANLQRGIVDFHLVDRGLFVLGLVLMDWPSRWSRFGRYWRRCRSDVCGHQRNRSRSCGLLGLQFTKPLFEVLDLLEQNPDLFSLICRRALGAGRTRRK